MESRIARVQEQKMQERKAALAQRYTVHVLREMADGNTKLVEFFKELQEQVEKVSEEKLSEYETRIQECVKMIEQNIGHKKDLEARLGESGIQVSIPISYGLGEEIFHTERGDRDAFKVYQLFNGHRLNEEMITEVGLKRIKETRESTARNNTSIDAEIATLENEIKEDERKIRHTISGKKKGMLEQEIEEDKERLGILKSSKRSEAEAQEMIDFIESLTPEQKYMLMRYFSTTEALIETAKLIDAYRGKKADVKSLKDREIMPEAFDRMIVANGKTEKDIVGLFSLLRRVEKKIGVMPHEKRSPKKDMEMQDYKEVVEKFLEQIYEPEKDVEHQSYLKRFKKDEEKTPEEEEEQKE